MTLPVTANVNDANRGSSALWVRILPLLVIAAGIGSIGLGFAYGIMTVGVPYHDASPELLQRQSQHLAITDVLIGVGAVLFVVGILMAVIWTVLWYCKRGWSAVGRVPQCKH